MHRSCAGDNLKLYVLSALQNCLFFLHLMFQVRGGSNEIVGVFYKANEYASLNPNFLGCVENALGIREWLESNGHQYIVTDDKEGPNCGKLSHTVISFVM